MRYILIAYSILKKHRVLAGRSDGNGFDFRGLCANDELFSARSGHPKSQLAVVVKGIIHRYAQHSLWLSVDLQGITCPNNWGWLTDLNLSIFQTGNSECVK